MAKVNYIIEHKSFMQLACQHMLSANEITLYNVLLMYFNELAVNSEWEDGFVSIHNKHLLAMLPFSEDMLIKTRAKLLGRGLGIFEFVAGKKRGEAPQYKLCYFSAKKREEKPAQVISMVIPKKIEEKTEVVEVSQTLENTIVCEDIEQSEKVAKCEDIAIDFKKEDIKIEQAITAIEKGLGFKLNDTQKRTAKLWAGRYRFDKDIYLRAASLSMSKNEPLQYLNKLLFNWDLRGVPEPTKAASYSEKRVGHQNYPQRVYSEEEFNVWTPDFGELASAYN